MLVLEDARCALHKQHGYSYESSIINYHRCQLWLWNTV